MVKVTRKTKLGVMGALKALVAELDEYGDIFDPDTKEIIEAARIVTQQHIAICECGSCPPRI